MLVLSRKEGESIELEGLGSIHIEQLKGNRVRVRLDLPKSVKIRRSELASDALASRDSLIAAHHESGQHAALRGCKRLIWATPSQETSDAWYRGYDSVPIHLRSKASLTGPIPAQLLNQLPADLD